MSLRALFPASARKALPWICVDRWIINETVSTLSGVSSGQIETLCFYSYNLRLYTRLNDLKIILKHSEAPNVPSLEGDSR